MRKLQRTGTSSKVIHYSQPKRDKRFEYQNTLSLKQYDPSIELKGNLHTLKNNQKQIPLQNQCINQLQQPQNSEFDPFRRMRLKDLPDTKRTLVPTLDPEPQKILRSRSSLHIGPPKNQESNVLFHNLTTQPTLIVGTAESRPKTPAKTSNSFKSSVFAEGGVGGGVVGTVSGCNGVYSRPVIKFSEFSKYNHTTQITHLPGGEKRRQVEIHDDQSALTGMRGKNSEKHFQRKVEVDYKSNIACLPNSGTKHQNEMQGKAKNQVHLKNTFNIFDNDYYNQIPKQNQMSTKEFYTDISKTPRVGGGKINFNSINNYNNYNTNTNIVTNNNNPSNSKIANNSQSAKGFNFFNTSNKAQTRPRIETKYNAHINAEPLVNEKNSVVVKQFNSMMNNVETYKILNAHKQTGYEKDLIPHPKQKIKGFRNPYVTQFKIK